MESLMFAFIASRHLYRREETVIVEKQNLPPLDLQLLRYVHGATGRLANRSTDRNDSPLAHALS
jgi:hypothetical protein